LVTSAAVAGFTPFAKISYEEWSRYVAVNLTGTFTCVQAALPDMTAAGWGRIITISSAAGQTGVRHQGHYSATKGGVIALTKTVALEFAAKGVTANSVSPCMADTPMLRAAQTANKILPSETLVKADSQGETLPSHGVYHGRGAVRLQQRMARVGLQYRSAKLDR
jgi:2-hydroxycyclohexanecarboxyl-CoA dehydrogenase